MEVTWGSFGDMGIAIWLPPLLPWGGMGHEKRLCWELCAVLEEWRWQGGNLVLWFMVSLYIPVIMKDR